MTRKYLNKTHYKVETFEMPIEEDEEIVVLKAALTEAIALLLRCHRWTEGEASVMVPVQKLRQDIEAWGRKLIGRKY